MNDTDLLFDFLKTRQLHCSKKLDLVGVINFGGGKENYCLTNAENKAGELGYAVISGLNRPGFTRHFLAYKFRPTRGCHECEAIYRGISN
jgi:hypothetical protein